MNEPMALWIFEIIVESGRFRWNKLLRKPGFLQKLSLEAGGGQDVHRVASCSGFGERTLQSSFTGCTVKGRFDERIFPFEGIHQRNDLLIVKRAIEYDFAFRFNRLFRSCGRENDPRHKDAHYQNRALRITCFIAARQCSCSAQGREDRLQRQLFTHEALFDLVAVERFQRALFRFSQGIGVRVLAQNFGLFSISLNLFGRHIVFG
jgi:hypothetical protein